MMENPENFLKFKKILEFAFNNKFSDFYRLKYEKAGFNPLSDFNSPRDIAKIPFVTKEELMGTGYQERLFVKEEEVEFLSITSGTTGKPFMIFYSKMDKFSDPDALSNVDFGRMLIMLNPLRTLVASLAHKRQRRPGLLITGDIHDMATACKLAQELGINTLQATPTIAIIMKDYIEKYPGFKKSLKYLLLGGEVMTPAKKKLIKELYPSLKILAKYVMSESGLVADQCHYLAERENQVYYHTRNSESYLEVIDPETGKEAEPGEEGELIVTSFWNFATPMIRYKTGDLVSFHKNDCPCGTLGPLLQVAGRTNKDVVKAGGLEFRRDALEKPFLNLKNYLREGFEAHIYENYVSNKPKIKIILNLSLKDGIQETFILKATIKDELLKSWWLSSKLNLEKAVEAGIVEVPEINFVEFPESAKAKEFLILHQ